MFRERYDFAISSDQTASLFTNVAGSTKIALSNRAFKTRLTMYLDGNGISDRLYKLLAYKSYPLKQTLLRVWHGDRLVPWVHYVPVSIGVDELPELVSYLTLSEVGMERAKKITEAGREWFGKSLKEVDMDIYLYRLLLELVRLQDPQREAGEF